MIIRKKRVSDKLYFLHFQNQREMAETFLRFQEFYESPKFKGKIFTLENYKDWYRKIKGKFSYYSDWDGFNLPSKILKPFYDGKFNPLSDKEKQLLSIFKKMKGNYYIVAVAGKKHKHKHTLKHEIAHGLFHLNKIYKKEVLELIKKYKHKLSHVENKLKKMGGYAEHVLNDEIHAYTVSLSDELDVVLPDEFEKEMNECFFKHCKNKKYFS